MLRSPTPVLAFVLAATLAACQTAAPVGSGPSPKGKTTARPTPAGSAPTTTKPGTPGEVVPLRTLLAPPGKATLLSGVVRLDSTTLLGAGGKALDSSVIAADGGSLVGAGGSTLVGAGGSNLVGAGGSTLVGAGGSSLVGAGGSTLIGNDGAGLIANSQGQIVAGGGGNLIGHDGAGLVGQDGATLIKGDGSTLIGHNASGVVSHDGAGLVGAGGSTLVGAGGGTLIGNDGAGYRLAQAATGKPTAVAGALVGAIDLATGLAVPIGVDATGKPVFLAYTDAKGEFKLFLPESQAGNVLVVSSAPGARDGRLATNAIARPAHTDGLVVSEASTTVAAYVRTSLTVRIAARLAANGEETVLPDKVVELFDSVTRPILDMFYKTALAGGYAKLGPVAQRRCIQAAADFLLSDVDLDAIAIEPAAVLAPVGIPGNALEVLRDVLGRIDRAAATRSFGDLAALPTFKVAALTLPAGSSFTFHRPGDIGDAIVRHLVATEEEGWFDEVDGLFFDMGLGAEPDLRLAIRASAMSVLLKIGRTMLLKSDRAVEILKTRIEAELAQATPEPAMASPAPLPAAPRAEVTTFAGSGTTLAAEGPRATAGFGEPAAMAFGPEGSLYIADPDHHRIRRVDPAGTVSTIGGVGDRGEVDGPGATAQFNKPMGMAFGPDGALYVADEGGNTIRRISGLPDAPIVTTVAGALAGDRDGQGTAASFQGPSGLAFGPEDGKLYVADRRNDKVRRVDPATGRVETFAGTGKNQNIGGKRLSADFEEPIGLAFGADGELFVSEFASYRIRRIRKDDLVDIYAATDQPGVADGVGPTARFGQLGGLAMGPGGNLYVADTMNHRIRVVTPSRVVLTVAGGGERGAGKGQFVDGPGADARFAEPLALTVGPDGALYIGDAKNHRVRKIVLTSPGS